MLDTTYDVVFDEEFPGALELLCTGKRGYRLNPTALINISYGHRKFKGQQKYEKTMAVVKPQVTMKAFFFFSGHYTALVQSWTHDLTLRLNPSRSLRVQGSDRWGHTSTSSIVRSSLQSHTVCPSSL